MKTLSERMSWAIEDKGCSITELAIAAGVKPPSVSDWLNGKTKTLKSATAIRAAKFLRVNLLWLTEGAGLMRDPPLSAPAISNLPAAMDGLSPSSNIEPSLTLAYSSASARQKNNKDEVVLRQFDTGGSMGGGVLLRDQPGVIQSWQVTREWLNKNVKSHSGADNLSIVTGFGDSMRPMYNPGDPLIIDEGVTSVDFDAVYFFRVGNEGFIKRLQRIPGEGLRAISANKEYESWTIRADMDFQVFGRVLKVWCSEDF